MTLVALATEDELSETVGRRLLAETEGRLKVDLFFRKAGFGYLRDRIRDFCQIARHHPVVLITDLDRGECPKALIDLWLGSYPAPGNLLFRVAVREIEAWLLADHAGMAVFFGLPGERFPLNPDDLEDPKARLLHLAKKAPRAIRSDLVVTRGAVASQGLGYNAVLGRFVRENWDPVRAGTRSESLRRAMARIKALATRATAFP